MIFTAMEEAKKSKLFIASAIELRDDLEEKMEKGYEFVTKVMGSSSEREAHDSLNAVVCKGMKEHEDITLGLLYSILTSPTTAPKTYRDLALISRDGLSVAWTKLNQIVVDKYTKLQDGVRTQLVWVTKEMVKNSVTGVVNVCSSLIKQIAGGDIHPKNVWLAEAMLDLFTENKAWLDKYPVLMAMVLYTYLRVIEDHSSQMLASLRQREVDFCIGLLRSKFMECCRIGRDLLRLLQNVARIPEFEKLWKDMIHRPQSLNPQFTGVAQLMSQRTSPKYLACRLTPEMEKKIIFLTSKVRFGQQKRYQDWFQKQFLSTPESQSLRCDLIRYICCTVHPSNEVLCSEIIQRWAVIGWLLTTCSSNAAASCAKLALFYDWLLFNPTRGNIMDIEPAILVMHHSMRSHPAITATLLDFLCRIIPNLHPPLEQQIKQGVMSALRFLLEKRVLPSLAQLFDNPKLDRELRAMTRDMFAEFCTTTPTTPTAPATPMLALPPEDGKTEPESANNDHGPIQRLPSEDATFSDEEEEDRSLRQRNQDSAVFRPIKQEEEVDLDMYLDQLDGEIKEMCSILQSQRDSDIETQCETMENLCSVILEMDDFDSDIAGPLATFLCSLYKRDITGETLPDEITDETMEDSLGKPICVIFRNLSADAEQDSCPLQLLTLVCMMYEKQIQIGYNLLYFLHASSSKQGERRLHMYEEVCRNTGIGDLTSCLVRDFKACAEEDVRLMCYLVSPVYTMFCDATTESTDLLHTIVSCVDSAQLQDLICDVMQGNLMMFKKENIAKVLEATLEWETFEQYCVWQILLAHDLDVDQFVAVIPKLTYKEHPEAMASLLLMLKLERISLDLLKPLMLRPCKDGDRFVSSILSYWAVQDEQHLADFIKTLLVRATTSAKRLRQRQTSKPSNIPSPDQILGHLEALRQTSAIRQSMFFSQEAVLLGLQTIQSACTDAQKMKFSDLFGLIEDLDDMTSRTTRSRVTRRSPGSSSPKNRKAPQNDVESSSESDQDDDISSSKPKPAKKRKKSNALGGSDSD
ncbi:integrator complex subunit 3-like isoform X1 [Patiria miniata]|uniref:SOSS complex subunit A homolog n=1 Tax=Patiria miniata TaxID=46514 RepID=A0A914AW94_PATMI|nr:integrator complex subunit 3-like isoform X1 [Patiria miniata]